MFALLNNNIFPMMRRSMNLEYNDSSSMREKFLFLTAHKKKNSLVDMSQNLKYFNYGGLEQSQSNIKYHIGKVANHIQKLAYSTDPCYTTIITHLAKC